MGGWFPGLAHPTVNNTKNNMVLTTESDETAG